MTSAKKPARKPIPKKPTKRPKPVSFLMERYKDLPSDPIRRRRARIVGLTTHLGLFEYLAKLFEANETLPAHRKLTDEALRAVMLKEFAHCKSFVRQANSGKGSIVNYYRYRYNVGKLRGVPPGLISYRYNEIGIPVDFRTGKKVLTHNDKTAIVQRFREEFIRRAKQTRILSDDRSRPTPTPAAG